MPTEPHDLPDPVTGPPPPLDPEARFVTRLALDLIVAHARVSGGFSIKSDHAVTQAVGLFQETKRQLADVRAGRTSIRESQAPAATEAA